MKYINRIIISLVGMLFILSSCESELPFPDAERVTLVTLKDMDGSSIMTLPTDPNKDIRVGASLHKFGGTEYSKVEFWLVRNPTTDDYVNVKLSEITSGLSLDSPLENTFKLGNILDQTGGDLSLGELLVFYYNMEMPDGTKSTGWSKVTGFTADNGIDNVEGQASYLRYRVVCDMSFEDLLGNWLWSCPNFIEDDYEVVATEDPEKPGAGLIFTFQGDGIIYEEPPPMNPLKMGIDMGSQTFTYTRQTWWPNVGHWGMAAYTNFYVGAAAGEINACGTITIRFTSARAVDQGGWGNFPTILTKMP